MGGAAGALLNLDDKAEGFAAGGSGPSKPPKMSSNRASDDLSSDFGAAVVRIAAKGAGGNRHGGLSVQEWLL